MTREPKKKRPQMHPLAEEDFVIIRAYEGGYGMRSIKVPKRVYYPGYGMIDNPEVVEYSAGTRFLVK